MTGFYGNLKGSQSDAMGSAKAFSAQRLSLLDRPAQIGISQSFINHRAVSSVLKYYCTDTKQTLESKDFASPIRATKMASSGDRIGNSGVVTLDVPATLWNLVGRFDCLGTVGGD